MLNLSFNVGKLSISNHVTQPLSEWLGLAGILSRVPASQFLESLPSLFKLE